MCCILALLHICMKYDIIGGFFYMSLMENWTAWIKEGLHEKLSWEAEKQKLVIVMIAWWPLGCKWVAIPTRRETHEIQTVSTTAIHCTNLKSTVYKYHPRCMKSRNLGFTTNIEIVLSLTLVSWLLSLVENKTKVHPKDTSMKKIRYQYWYQVFFMLVILRLMGA